MKQEKRKAGEEQMNTWFFRYLVCPDCGGKVAIEDGVHCKCCGYTTGSTTPLDLRPMDPGISSLNLLRRMALEPSRVLESIDTSLPEITYQGPSAIRDSAGLMSEISRYLGEEGKVLDLGCGPRDQAESVEYLGYDYVGLDYSGEKADILGDAHAIPFRSKTFNCVLSYAVLEHLCNPLVALIEIERVLKPGGIYIGTVSQGEPFHESYFHQTPWGFVSLVLSATNLKIEKLWSTGDTLGSLSRMGRYPRAIKWLISIVDRLHRTLPYLAPRRMKWSEKEKSLDELYRAGSIGFVVRKEY